MPKFLISLLGLLIILFVYYIIIWFITNQQNAFKWDWYVKLIYVLLIYTSWGNFNKNMVDKN